MASSATGAAPASSSPPPAPATLQPTAIKDIPSLVQEARDFFESDQSKSLDFRRTQLRQLYKLIRENEDALCATEVADLACSPHFTVLSTISMCYNDLALSISNLDSWAAPEYPSVPLVNKLDKCQVRSEPKGVVLIIGAWNYPLQLTLVPLIGAIASGCCAIIKPSELAPTSAMALAALLPKYLNDKAFKVVNGAVAETTSLLEQKFDHILYTGNSQVARVIATAAAKHLTPLTLELGGKSPAIVDKDVDLTIVARRLAWGAFINCGQTCVRVDYVMCHAPLVPQLVAELKKALVEFYGDDPRLSPDLGRIINARHYKRITDLVDQSKGKIEFGNARDPLSRYLSPTVVTNVDGTDALMQSEIFGPVLPILAVQSIEQAIAYVKAHEKPLALYVFTNSSAVAEKVVAATSSGGVVINDVLMHATVDALPFGGIGESGMGAYHGKHTFDMFSHKRAMMHKSLSLEYVNTLRYPPLNPNKIGWLSSLVMSHPPSEKKFWFF